MAKPSRRPKRKHWGLRTLGFLAIALVAVLTANTFAPDGRGYAPITWVGVLVGFGGAAYCTFQGLRDFTWLPR